jgi:GABA permease
VEVTWKRNLLVVANVTAASDELIATLKDRSAQGACSFRLIVPATPLRGGREAAQTKLREALSQLHEAGLEGDGAVGDSDPLVAVTEAWDPKRYDEIIVCTLPMRLSKWLHAGLPERIAKLTDAPVTHVVAQPPRPPVESAPPRSREGAASVMGPLQVLGWGGHKPR